MKYIKTCDIFDIKDERMNTKCYTDCCRIAKELGVFDTLGICTKTYMPKINLAGRKDKVVRYYIRTLLKTDHKIDGIKRVIDIILT